MSFCCLFVCCSFLKIHLKSDYMYRSNCWWALRDISLVLLGGLADNEGLLSTGKGGNGVGVCWGCQVLGGVFSAKGGEIYSSGERNP